MVGVEVQEGAQVPAHEAPHDEADDGGTNLVEIKIFVWTCRDTNLVWLIHNTPNETQAAGLG